MSELKVRVGIIGTGGIANAHVERFREADGVDIVACLDVDPVKSMAFAERHGIPIVATNFDELIERVDAVSIVTTDRFHAEFTIKVLEHGKHVLCEKPLTVTFDEARAVAAAARKANAAGIINMVNFSYRGAAAFQEGIRLAKTGVLGEIRHVHSFYLQQWLVTENIDPSNPSSGWLWRLASSMGSAGTLGDIGCHILDLTSACSEDFTAIRCDLRTYPKLIDGEYVTSVKGVEFDANDTALIEFQLEKGGVGICHTTRWATGHGNHLRFEVHGTEGSFSFDLSEDSNSINLCLGDDFRKAGWSNTSVPTKLPPTPTNWQRFITSIQTGVQDQPDIARGAVVQSYLDTCFRSATSGQWEKVISPF